MPLNNFSMRKKWQDGEDKKCYSVFENSRDNTHILVTHLEAWLCRKHSKNITLHTYKKLFWFSKVTFSPLSWHKMQNLCRRSFYNIISIFWNFVLSTLPSGRATSFLSFLTNLSSSAADMKPHYLPSSFYLQGRTNSHTRRDTF